MSEQLYFFKFDRVKAREQLVTKITNQTGYTYQAHIDAEEDPEIIIYKQVVSKVKNNVEDLSADELWSIEAWFNEKNERLYPQMSDTDRSYLTSDEMQACGLDCFYEMLSKTPIRKLHYIMGEYEWLTQQEIGYSWTKVQFEGFLNYLICYTGELTIFLNDHYYDQYNDEQENDEIRELIHELNLETDSYFHQLALAQIEKERTSHFETIRLVSELKKFRKANEHLKVVEIPSELVKASIKENDLINLAAVLSHGIQLKEVLANYQGVITRLHSF